LPRALTKHSEIGRDRAASGMAFRGQFAWQQS
jgi:hypothetical protein